MLCNSQRVPDSLDISPGCLSFVLLVNLGLHFCAEKRAWAYSAHQAGPEALGLKQNLQHTLHMQVLLVKTEIWQQSSREGIIWKAPQGMWGMLSLQYRSDALPCSSADGWGYAQCVVKRQRDSRWSYWQDSSLVRSLGQCFLACADRLSCQAKRRLWVCKG